jgi:HK97 family phage major capsid protein
MTTLIEGIAQLREQIQHKLTERNAHATSLAELRGQQTAGATVDETKVEEHRAAKAALDTELDELSGILSQREAEQAADEQAKALNERLGKKYDEVARVGAEKRTYNPESDGKGAQFLRDTASAFLGDYDARERISRHMAEERVERGDQIRAAGTGAFAGLTVPQYLTDLVAPAAAAARPLANICTPHDLPSQGMTVNISRITTATSAAAQSAENAAVSETNIDDTLLTESIFTVAGQQTLSRQAIERSTGAEDVTLNDLVRRYHTALDSKLINDATTGLTNVAQNVAYTDATPTAAELWPKILNAQANLEAVMLDLGTGSEYAVMHSRRWAWLQSQVGTSWPFIAQPGVPTQAGGVNTGAGYGDNVRGVLPNGTKVIVDNNISTALGAGTEDEIYFVNAAELHLWEDANAPVYIRAEQPAVASLGVLMVVYGYAAYSFRRYTNGQQKISGTGLIAPTF